MREDLRGGRTLPGTDCLRRYVVHACMHTYVHTTRMHTYTACVHACLHVYINRADANSVRLLRTPSQHLLLSKPSQSSLSGECVWSYNRFGDVLVACSRTLVLSPALRYADDYMTTVSWKTTGLLPGASMPSKSAARSQ